MKHKLQCRPRNMYPEGGARPIRRASPTSFWVRGVQHRHSQKDPKKRPYHPVFARKLQQARGLRVKFRSRLQADDVAVMRMMLAPAAAQKGVVSSQASTRKKPQKRQFWGVSVGARTAPHSAFVRQNHASIRGARPPDPKLEV